MPNLAKLVANAAPAVIDFGGGDVLHVTYYPARLTSAMLLALADTTRVAELSQERAVAVMTSAAETLAALLATWDLTETAADGSEQVIPLDHAHIAALGLPIQWRILNGVMAAQASAGAGEAAAPEA